jgi:hypothetical protein
VVSLLDSPPPRANPWQAGRSPVSYREDEIVPFDFGATAGKYVRVGGQWWDVALGAVSPPGRVVRVYAPTSRRPIAAPDDPGAAKASARFGAAEDITVWPGPDCWAAAPLDDDGRQLIDDTPIIAEGRRP